MFSVFILLAAMASQHTGLRGLSVKHLCCHEVCLLAFLAVLRDEVGEEKEFQYYEDNKQFYAYYKPQRLAQLHVAEAVIIEVEDSVKETVFLHECQRYDKSKVILRKDNKKIL